LKGEQLLAQATEIDASTVASAEACFNQSIAIAQRQKARSLMLRAVMSLARLHQDQGRHATALGLLVETYRSFTEGFDTVDLRDANALLDEFSSGTLT
jgi:hypothetical protein